MLPCTRGVRCELMGRPVRLLWVGSNEGAPEGIDLIVMSTHGRTGLAHMLIGSAQTQLGQPAAVLTRWSRRMTPNRANDTLNELTPKRCLHSRIGQARCSGVSMGLPMLANVVQDRVLGRGRAVRRADCCTISGRRSSCGYHP